MKQSELKNIMEYSILSRNHGTGKVITHKWTETLIEKITKAYSLGTRNGVERMLLDGNAVNCPNATFTLVKKDSVRYCVRCENAFVMSDTMPDRIYCSEICWQLTKHESKLPYQPNLTSSLHAICNDARTISDIEHTGDHAIFTSEIVFVDDNGNQYEYDGVCISEGKLKVRIKPIYNIRLKK